MNAQVQAGLASVRIPKHIELVTELAPGLPKIPCTALDLVVENLALNAVKAMQGKLGSLRVWTWLDERLPREPFIVITVEDTGVGMTRDELDRLFEPRRDGHRGSGLGFGMMWVRSWGPARPWAHRAGRRRIFSRLSNSKCDIPIEWWSRPDRLRA